MNWMAPLAAAATWDTTIQEIRERYTSGLTEDAAYGVKVALVGVGLTCVLWLAKATPGWWRAVAMFFAAGAAALGIKLALAQAWLADDAFISFRYADNFARGNGLVWNVGERVEGYTNFLWTVLIALAQLLGIQPAYSATAMTLGCLLVLALVGTWKLSKPGWVPLAPVLLVISPAFAEFGTSGLEAGPTALCAGLAALLLADSERRHLAAWLILAAALLRPDHALFFVPLGLLQLFAGRKAILHTIGAGVAFGIYWLGRWAYFGELLPNTFHAKSGGGAYWSQGAIYWAEFSLATSLWILVPLVLLAALVLAVSKKKDALPWAAVIFALVGGSVFAAYVARVGGDFMEFRFGLTTYVLVAFGADLLLSRLAGPRVWATVMAGLVLVPLGFTPTMIKPGEKKWHIARESSFYKLKTWSPLEVETGQWATGKALASLPNMGADAPPLAAGCIGIVGYLSRVRIVDRYGLTNAAIARKEIKERGRPGHEKWATDAELRAEGAEWTVDPTWEEPLKTRTKFRIGDVNFWVLKYTPTLPSALPVPPLADVLAGIRSLSEARAQMSAVNTLFESYPGVFASWEQQWNFVDPREFKTEGENVETTLSRVTAKRRLTFSTHRACSSTAQRLRWKTMKGACTPQEVRCTGGELEAAVSCTGEDISLEGFSFEPIDYSERLRWALPLGADAIADVVREQDDSLDGMISRIRFDTAADLSRPELQGASGLFDVTSKPAPGQGVITNIEGAGFLNGFAKGGDTPKGKLTITVPVTKGKPVLVSFMFAGGFACEKVRAVLRDGPLERLKACGRQDEVLRPSSTIVTPASDRLVLEVLDDEDKPWGHALMDEFFVWSMPDPNEAAQR